MDLAIIKKELEKVYGNEDGVAIAWNHFLAKHSHLVKKPYTIELNTKDTIEKKSLYSAVVSSIFDGSYDVNERYLIVTADGIETINSVYAVIDAEKLYKQIKCSSNRVAWESASNKAITLWNTPYEEVKVEITKQYLKFYRRDDILSCYTYPPIHELKKDDKFKQDMKFILEESGDWDETMFKNWIMGDCDLPPFPISCIFASDYNKYKFFEFE